MLCRNLASKNTFYTYPLDSCKLHIYFVTNLAPDMHAYGVQHHDCKMVLLPHKQALCLCQFYIQLNDSAATNVSTRVRILLIVPLSKLICKMIRYQNVITIGRSLEVIMPQTLRKLFTLYHISFLEYQTWCKKGLLVLPHFSPILWLFHQFNLAKFHDAINAAYQCYIFCIQPSICLFWWCLKIKLYP